MILLLFIGIIFELAKRIITLPIYPLAYWCRKAARDIYAWPWDRALWLLLDDSIHKEGVLKYGKDIEYCWYGKRCDFVEKYLPYDWARSWYWGGFRNNCINFAIKTEEWVGTYQYAKYMRTFKVRGFYAIRVFNHATLPYFEYWIGNFRIQAGWLTCGRFQVQARNL